MDLQLTADGRPLLTRELIMAIADDVYNLELTPADAGRNYGVQPATMDLWLRAGAELAERVANNPTAALAAYANPNGQAWLCYELGGAVTKARSCADDFRRTGSDYWHEYARPRAKWAHTAGVPDGRTADDRWRDFAAMPTDPIVEKSPPIDAERWAAYIAHKEAARATAQTRVMARQAPMRLTEAQYYAARNAPVMPPQARQEATQ